MKNTISRQFPEHPKGSPTFLIFQARSAEVVTLSREAAELMDRLATAEAAADRYEAKYRAAKSDLQQTRAVSAEQSAELEHLSESLSHEQTMAKSSQEGAEDLSRQLKAVQVS